MLVVDSVGAASALSQVGEGVDDFAEGRRALPALAVGYGVAVGQAHPVHPGGLPAAGARAPGHADLPEDRAA